MTLIVSVNGLDGYNGRNGGRIGRHGEDATSPTPGTDGGGNFRIKQIIPIVNTISVNGLDGYNGRNGGRIGRHGEDATSPTPGTDGGEIDIYLVERDNFNGALAEISGQYRKPGYQVGNFQQTYICATDDLFILEARGGNGGNGGNGGDGADGLPGKDGKNATSYSSGGNGKRGGDGGDAGAGTSGADGGEGGIITLRMLDTDAGLLMMFVESWIPTVSYALDISGGKGGETYLFYASNCSSGATDFSLIILMQAMLVSMGHQVRADVLSSLVLSHSLSVGTISAGCGGPGGKGGSGYSWTETKQIRDYNGCYVTQSVSHYNSGGYDGSPGFPGHGPTHLLYGGRTGDDGSFRFLIRDSTNNKLIEYDEIFDLRLHHVVAHSVTGVFEPEAQIYIDRLTIVNTSKMPTPRRDICVTVNNSVWISNKVKIDYATLPQVITPQTSLEVDCRQFLSFFLRKHIVDHPGPPLRATDLLQLTATMMGIRRIFPAFDIEGRPINIQYPIEFTHISYINSMVVSQIAKVKWGVQNRSEVDFGSLAPNGRCIRVRLDRKAGEVSPSALRFGLKAGQQGVATVHPVQTLEKEYLFEIPLLRAGETLQLEATLELVEAEIFEHVEFWLYLELGQVWMRKTEGSGIRDIMAPYLPKVVHIQSFSVRVSTIYRGFPAGFYPDVLLVTNHKTTRDEFMAWTNLLKQQLGLRFFVWDISQMGYFGFTRPIPTLYSNEPTTLMKDLAGKTMIILDNEFEYGDYARTVTALNFVIKREADRNSRLVTLENFARTPFEAWKQKKRTFERVRNLTYHLTEITDAGDFSKDTGEQDDDEASEDNTEIPDILDDIENPTADTVKLVDEVIDIKIKAKLFRKMQTRMAKKAMKVCKNLKTFRPHIQHLVIYQWHEAKKPLFRTKKNCNEKTGGCITVIPSLSTTKQRIVFSAAAWDESPTTFVQAVLNLRGVIAGLGIDIHFRLLERIFITGPINEDNETDDIGLFLAGGFRILDEGEKQLAGVLKQQIVYDVAVELSTICDGIAANSTLKDEQILEMMESLRRLVWKTESLSGSTSATTKENSLATIAEEVSEIDQAHFDQNNGYGDEVVGTPQIYSEPVRNNRPNTTALGDINEEETTFFMFPVGQNTPLGEWLMDVLAQLYAFIKCLRAGIHQSILPNRRTVKIQQQSMDLLHRVGDATIVGFADPRSSDTLEALCKEQSTALGNQMSKVNEKYLTPPNINNENQQGIEIVAKVDSGPNPSTQVPNQFNGLSLHSSAPKSIASGLSFASAMTSATRMSSSSFSSSGTSASRSRVSYKKLDTNRQKTIKSFKQGAKLQLRKMIQNHYKQWKKDANYFLGGVFDPSKKALRRCAKEAVFGPFEVLVDNTLYGRDLTKKDDGQMGGVKNIIISDPEYEDMRTSETHKINDLEDMISKFFNFQSNMIDV
ncbi:hypothetical protein Glove_195g36 [Diversispora epigaea]|uniref:DUF7932 domain-containing protein n=1 Tax=Diversispora epigaea TaxID=1348612 RepID=A0A397IVF1_9GLOM|nr:hypothetical protein Glove_195g36 [Diversispora epigaea]